MLGGDFALFKAACITAEISVHIGLTTRVAEAEQLEKGFEIEVPSKSGTRRQGVLGRSKVAQYNEGLDTLTQLCVDHFEKQPFSHHIKSQA